MNKSTTNTLIYLKSFLFYKRFIISFFILFNFILWIRNFNYFYEFIKISDSFYSGFYNAFLSVYDVTSTYDTKSLVIILTSITLSSINISLLLKYLDFQKHIQNEVRKLMAENNSKNLARTNSSKNNTLKKQNSLTSFAIFLAFIASHCASCGAALFGSFISLAFLSYLPFGGLEVGVISILVLTYTNYDLIKKINNPYVC